MSGHHRAGDPALRDLLESTENAVFAVDAGGIVLAANAPARLSGYAPEEAYGRPLSEVFLVTPPVVLPPPLFRFPFPARLVTREGKTLDIEYMVVPLGATDTRHAVVFRATPPPSFPAGSGELADILQGIPDIIYRLDADANITFISDAVQRYGYSPNALIGKSLFTLIHPDDREAVKYKVNERRTGDRRTTNVPFRLLVRQAGPGAEKAIARCRGQYPVMLLEAQGIYRGEAPAQERFCGTQGVARDVSEKVWAEQALRESEQRYRALVENTDVGIALVDAGHTVLMANSALAAIYGLEPGEIVGSRCHEVFDGRKTPCEECPGAWAMETGLSRAVERKTKRRDGAAIVTRQKAFCVCSGGGPTGYTKFVEDVTGKAKAEEEKAKLQQELQQAQKMQAIGTLAGGIAHDFNNILGVIMSYAELSRLSARDPVKTAHNISQILNASLRAKELVQQILTFGRQKEADRRPLDIGHIVHEATRLIRATLPPSIELETRTGTDQSVVMADPIQVHQVLMNLCSNAEHAMEECGGKLTIAVERISLGPFDPLLPGDFPPGDYVHLYVRDTGRGMRQEVRARLFEPYFTTKQIGKGTGLGLAVVHGIVEAHGGAIWVESEPRKGAVFHILFPAVEAVCQQDEMDASLPQGRGEHVLLVDDEEMLLDANREMLQSLGYRVSVAASGEAALEQFHAAPESFDLVITDEAMPKMPGHVFARAVMAVRPDLPVMLCTGYGGFGTEEEAKALGVRGCIYKPYRLEDLASRVRQVLDGKDGHGGSGCGRPEERPGD
jgi:PAS domain S-box-containing protein